MCSEQQVCLYLPQGEFFSRKAPAEAPFSPPPMPGVTKTDKMLYVWLSDYMADTAGYVYQQAGVMQYELTPENTHVRTYVCICVCVICSVCVPCLCVLARLLLYLLCVCFCTCQCVLYFSDIDEICALYVCAI